MRNTYIEGLSYPITHPFRVEAERLRQAFDTNAYVVNGVVRWRSSDRVPPRDVLEFWRHVGKPFNFQKSLDVADRETKAFLREYRRRNANRPISPEERFEMEAAFGKGARVVDVITGRVTRL
jgi:hypothetical protein